MRMSGARTMRAPARCWPDPRQAQWLPRRGGLLDQDVYASDCGWRAGRFRPCWKAVAALSGRSAFGALAGRVGIELELSPPAGESAVAGQAATSFDLAACSSACSGQAWDRTPSKAPGAREDGQAPGATVDGEASPAAAACRPAWRGVRRHRDGYRPCASAAACRGRGSSRLLGGERPWRRRRPAPWADIAGLRPARMIAETWTA